MELACRKKVVQVGCVGVRGGVIRCTLVVRDTPDFKYEYNWGKKYSEAK